MKAVSNKRGQQGFTLVELMVVTVIMGFMVAAFVMPSFTETDAQRLEGEAWSLVGELRESRARAVMASAPTVVTFDTTARTVKEWVDLNRDDIEDAGEVELYSMESSHIGSMTATVASGTFESNGSFTVSNGSICRLTLSKSGTSFEIVIIPSGEVDPVWN